MRHLTLIAILALAGVFIILPMTVIHADGAHGDATYGGPDTFGKPAAEGNFFSGLTGTYRIGLSLVGISALFVIVWGGVNYITAGEDSSKVTQARQRIRNALVGILIAALSYALLRTINPDLVNFGIPTLQNLSPTNQSPTQ